LMAMSCTKCKMNRKAYSWTLQTNVIAMISQTGNTTNLHEAISEPNKIPQSDGDRGKHPWTAQAMENSNISVSSKESASPGLHMGYAKKKVQRYRWSAQVQDMTECTRASTYLQGELLGTFVPKVIRLVLSLILIHSWKSRQLDFVIV